MKDSSKKSNQDETFTKSKRILICNKFKSINIKDCPELDSFINERMSQEGMKTYTFNLKDLNRNLNDKIIKNGA